MVRLGSRATGPVNGAAGGGPDVVGRAAVDGARVRAGAAAATPTITASGVVGRRWAPCGAGCAGTGAPGTSTRPPGPPGAGASATRSGPAARSPAPGAATRQPTQALISVAHNSAAARTQTPATAGSTAVLRRPEWVPRGATYSTTGRCRGSGGAESGPSPSGPRPGGDADTLLTAWRGARGGTGGVLPTAPPASGRTPRDAGGCA